MRRTVLAFGLLGVGCGRVDFDALDDAGGDASSLVACPTSATAPPTVSITGTTFYYTDFDNTWNEVPNATVKALTRVGGTTLGQTTSDGAGAYSVSIPTGGQPTPVVLELSAGASYFTTFVILDLPLDRDLTAPAKTVNDLYSPADAPLWLDGGIDAIYTQVGLTRMDARGTVNIAVRDCADLPVTGVTVELDPPSPLLRYQGVDGKASATLTETGPPFAHALAFNSPAGPTRVIARKNGVVVADQTIEVSSGSTYTVATIRAPGS